MSSDVSVYAKREGEKEIMERLYVKIEVRKMHGPEK